MSSMSQGPNLPPYPPKRFSLSPKASKINKLPDTSKRPPLRRRKGHFTPMQPAPPPRLFFSPSFFPTPSSLFPSPAHKKKKGQPLSPPSLLLPPPYTHVETTSAANRTSAQEAGQACPCLAKIEHHVTRQEFMLSAKRVSKDHKLISVLQHLRTGMQVCVSSSAVQRGRREQHSVSALLDTCPLRSGTLVDVWYHERRWHAVIETQVNRLGVVRVRFVRMSGKDKPFRELGSLDRDMQPHMTRAKELVFAVRLQMLLAATPMAKEICRMVDAYVGQDHDTRV